MRVKMSKQPPPAPTASTVGPCPTEIQIVGRPGTRSLPRTIALPDHPLNTIKCPSSSTQQNLNFDFLKLSGRNALLCKCFSDLMKSYWYLQRNLASIHKMTSLQAILTAFKEVVAHAL